MKSSRWHGWWLALAALGIGFLAACHATDAPGTDIPRVPGAALSALLRPGDSLTIALQGIPDPSMHSVQVDEQGLINLPYIGSVPASGLTSAELSQRIRQTYIARNYYTSVDVSVTVTERYVYVGGEVAHPGRIIWTPDLTLTKAIQAAGGFTLYAKEARVTLVRDRSAYEINATLAQRQPEQDPRLVPGDSLQVPRSPF
jgi:protein involved in polysaccharide export with SLBB domain